MELNICFNCMEEKLQPGRCPHCGFDESTYETAPHHLPPGTILYGKYMIGRALGEGGFGITYVGWDLNLEMKVAVKEYYPNGFVTRNSTFSRTLTVLTGSRGEFFQKGVEKFVEEARRLGKFWRLPGIVAVKDYFQENKTAYIVMEFVQGSTLKEMLKGTSGGRLPAEQIFQMMRPVMKSLDKVHEAGLIHRDISPDNLMVEQEGEVKLIDFGAARDFLAEGEKSLSVMLKPGYAPEEQYRSRGNQGPWTDVYSLCATMYRAITGQVPEESLDRMAEDTLKRPSQLGVSLPEWQEEALMKGLAVFQKDRLQSMKELETALYTEPEETKKLEEELSVTQEERKKIEGAVESQEKTGEIEASGEVGERESQNGFRRKKLVTDSTRKKRLGPVIGGAAILLVILAICILVLREEEDSGKGELPMQAADAGAEVSPEDDGQESIQGTDQETTSNSEMDEPVVWTDKNLERFIRQGLGKSEGDIRKGDLADIRVLRIAKTGVALYKNVEEDEGSLYGADYKSVKEEEAITSLEDLKYFPNLTVLQVSSHKVADISALSGLDSLTVLDLGNNDLTDISVLSGLTGLTSLDLSNNDDLTDISVLSGLTGLTSLDLDGNDLTDISALSGLFALASLNLRFNDLTDISALSGLTALTSLSVTFNDLIDISELSGLTELTSLALSGNDLTDISELSGLTGLTSLYLSENDLTDISALSGLTGLTNLGLSSNDLTDISALSGLIDLTSLDLSYNGLTDISPLSNLASLKYLNLGDNERLLSINPLSQLLNLESLTIDKKWEADISCLDGIEGLEITCWD